jgi:hypothetical protein
LLANAGDIAAEMMAEKTQARRARLMLGGSFPQPHTPGHSPFVNSATAPTAARTKARVSGLFNRYFTAILVSSSM